MSAEREAAIAAYVNRVRDAMDRADQADTQQRQSIRPTYDSRVTGDRYHVTTTIDGQPLDFMKPIPDPFVRQTVTVGWPDLLRGLLHRRLVVEVTVGGDKDIQDDVLELDENTLIPGSTRHAAFHSHINETLARLGTREDGNDDG